MWYWGGTRSIEKLSSSAHWPRSYSGWMSYGLPNEALSSCRRTESSTLMDLHFETHLYLHSNNNTYMWNQVNCIQNYYTNIGMSTPYNQLSYPLVSCPHHWPTPCLGLGQRTPELGHGPRPRSTCRSWMIDRSYVMTLFKQLAYNRWCWSKLLMML
jgi:hypothetical protein